jgi:RNA polymerase primary sigma factor
LPNHYTATGLGAEPSTGTLGPQSDSRLAVAERLLRRYADADRVSERALAGVSKLCGLAETERDAIRSWFTVVPDEFESAIAAAYALMDEDRFCEHPDKRILSAEEEIGLSVLMRGGPERASEEPTEEELAGLPASDVRRRACDCLILHNQRLVHSILKPYFHVESPALGYEDLFQHGALGLMRAARKFDPAMGNKFSTYATWWVKQHVQRAVDDFSRTVRIPVHLREDLRKLRKTEARLFEAGREVDDAMIAAACNWSVEKVHSLRLADSTVVSLEKIVNEDTELADLVAGHHVGADEHALAVDEVTGLDRLLRLFPERTRTIIVGRAGLDGGEERTLDQLGLDVGVTRERIRQIEGAAYKKLRAAYGDPRGDPYAALRERLAEPAKEPPRKYRTRGRKPSDTPRRTDRLPAPATGRPRGSTR